MATKPVKKAVAKPKTEKVKVNVRGRVVSKTIPVAAKKKPAAKAGDWFANLSKKAQAEYIKAHPNSKYAKGSKAAKAPAKPTSVAGRVADAAKRYTNTANSLIKKAKEKMEAAKTPATKAKWKAEIARLAVIKKDLKALGAKGKGISVTLKGGTIESVSGSGRKTSTTRKLPTKAANKQSPVAVKAKAHEAKRAADKKKVVAKTPTAKTKIKEDIAYWKEELSKFKQVLKTTKTETSRMRAQRAIKRAQYQIKDLSKKLTGK